jgi:YfiH family protein
VASYLELPGDALVGLKQVHGCRTLRVQGSGDRAVAREPADAAIADADDVGLVIKTADCVPILLADRLGRGVGAVHAGWRGTALWLAGSTAEALAGACGGCAEELVAAIGPSIGACCYEVGPEVRETFEAQAPSPAAGSAIARWLTAGAGDRLRLDLWEANRDQLIAAGVPASSIHVARLCTACHLDRFFSYRREGTRAGRLLAAIRRR